MCADIQNSRGASQAEDVKVPESPMESTQRVVGELLMQGAYLFAGMLTTRAEVVTFSGAHDASPAVSSLVEFRGRWNLPDDVDYSLAEFVKSGALCPDVLASLEELHAHVGAFLSQHRESPSTPPVEV